MININQRYYRENAQHFFESTVDVDMSSLYQLFLPLVKEGGRILDAGCGAGRDSKAFIKRGFEVEAFDASDELARLASKLINKQVTVGNFQTYKSNKKFDAIWACASLLHVPLNELPAVFLSLANQLKEGGFFYCSFKYGEGEVLRNGRSFTNLNESGFVEIIAQSPLSIQKQWITGDLRVGRESEQWLNVILRREN